MSKKDKLAIDETVGVGAGIDEGVAIEDSVTEDVQKTDVDGTQPIVDTVPESQLSAEEAALVQQPAETRNPRNGGAYVKVDGVFVPVENA